MLYLRKFEIAFERILKPSSTIYSDKQLWAIQIKFGEKSGFWLAIRYYNGMASNLRFSIGGFDVSKSQYLYDK